MKSDLEKKNAQLIEELERMRHKVSELEAYKTSYLASEKELRESKEKLRLMFEAVSDGITVTDLDGIITDVNKAVLKLGGFDSESDVVGMSAFESIAFCDRERALADMLELRQQDTVGAGQYDLLRADGSEYPAEVSAGLLKDAAGSPAGFVSVIRDIAERKMIEAALIKSENMFRSLAEQSPNMISITTREGIVYVNRKFKEVLGHEREEFYSPDFNLLKVTASEFTDRVSDSFKRCMAGEETPLFEFVLLTRDGRRLDVMQVTKLIEYEGEKAVLATTTDVTDWKQAENLLRDILEKSPVSVYILQDNIFQFVNPAFCQNTGYTESELLAMDPSKLVHSDDRKMVREKMLEMLEGKLSQPFEFRGINKDNSTQWIIMSVAPIRYQGKPAMLATPLNITERKQAEEIFQTISLRSPASIYIVQDGQFVFANPWILTNMDFSEDELFVTEPLSLVHPEDREMVQRYTMEMLNGTRTTPYEFRAFNKAGETRWFMETITPIQYLGKQASLGNAIDITERKRAEETLRESEERYKNLVELAPDAIISVDENGIVTSCNQAFAQQTGYDKQELVGKYFTELPTMSSPDNTEAYNKLFAALSSGGELESFEFPWIHKDGTLRWGEVRATVMMADRQFKGAQAIMRDITERKQAGEIFQTVSLRSPVGMYIIQDGKFVFANPQLLSDFGITEERLLAIKPLSRVRPKDREMVRQNAVEMLKGICTAPYEYGITNRAGETRWFMETVTPIQYRGRRAVLGNLLNITERKQTEERLRETRHRFRDLVNLLPLGVYEIDDKYNVTFANQRSIEASGYTEEEVNAAPLNALDTVAPEDRERMERNIQRMMNGEKLGGIEYTQRRRDGSTYPAMIYSTPIMRDGKAVGLRGVIIDITEQKQAEEMFQTISVSSPASIYIIQNGKFVFANHRLLDRMGFTIEELLTTEPYDLIQLGDRQMVRRSAIEMLKGIRTTPYEYRAFSKSGEMMWVAETVASIRYQGRRAVLGSALNITERKQAEEALRESEGKYRILVENSQDSIVILDFEGNIQLTNQASERLSGYSVSEGIGMNLAEVVAPAYREEALRKLMEAKNGKPVPYFETAVQRKDGTVVTVEACGQAIFKDGEAVGAQVIARDITERKRVEEERQRIERLESLGTLAGGIAHDFNNILTGIMGNIDLALRHIEPDGRAAQRLLEAEKASLRARDLTQQLLTFSKGSLPVKKNVSIGRLVEEAASFALRGSNVRFELAIPDKIWPVHVDEGQINGVISNLVINADEAMPQGGTIRIGAMNRAVGLVKLRSLPRGNYVEVTVEDYGVGIPHEYLDRIFEPYFTTKQKGSGLGLATAYSIVKNHDGHITVESKLGVGTTFHVFLPASKKLTPVEKEINDESSAHGGGKILVMDDEEAIQQLLQRALTEVGYEVLLTTDGEEAIEQYTRAREAGEPFDAVILDLTVPGKMGGREAMTKLLEIDPEVRAIASSGYSTDPVISDFRNYGFSGVVAKPYRISELIEGLREVVARKLD